MKKETGKTMPSEECILGYLRANRYDFKRKV